MERRLAAACARLRGIEVLSPFSFREHTTVGIGGTSPLALVPNSAEQLVSALRVLENEEVPFVLLGNGSNVLVSDAGFGGVVVLTKRVDHVEVRGDRVIAACGAPLAKVLRVAAKHGLGGIAFLAGIPATVGGAVFMNAGAGGKYIAERLESVTAYRRGTERLPACACDFAYKHSVFMQSGGAILGAEFRLFPMSAQAAEDEIAGALAARTSLPCGRSMGCVFKNPPGLSAGELIDRAGLKGAQCGGAFVSDRHANFIINGGGASSRDVALLIGRIREQVYRRFGVRLEEEIRMIGEQECN